MPRDLIPSRGRPGKILLMSVERQLTGEDLFRLATGAKAVLSVPPLQKLKASHHAAARALATGRTVREAAILVGCTPQRITDLQTDPSFKHLCDYYFEQINEGGIQDAERVQTKLRVAAETALDLLQERLDDPKEAAAIPTGELRQIGSFGFDRTIAPPKTAVPGTTPPVQVTFNMGPRDLRPGGEGKVVDHDDDGGNPPS